MLSRADAEGAGTTQKGRRRARGGRADATRRALLVAARELFGERGYAGTSVEEVVRRAGLTKGALYHHFRDKDDLFRAVVEQVKVDVTAAAADSFFDESDNDDPLQRVHRLFTAMIDAHL